MIQKFITWLFGLLGYEKIVANRPTAPIAEDKGSLELALIEALAANEAAAEDRRKRVEAYGELEKWKSMAIEIANRETELRYELRRMNKKTILAWVHAPSGKLLWPEEIEDSVFDEEIYTPLMEACRSDVL